MYLNRLAATYSRWGWRIITFGDTRPIVESNVQPLEGEYSKFINDTFDKGTETIFLWHSLVHNFSLV